MHYTVLRVIYDGRIRGYVCVILEYMGQQDSDHYDIYDNFLFGIVPGVQRPFGKGIGFQKFAFEQNTFGDGCSRNFVKRTALRYSSVGGVRACFA